MKSKILIIAGVILGLGLLVASFFLGPKQEHFKLLEDPNAILINAQQESSAVKDNERKKFIQINVNEYLEMYKKNETNLILISRTGCQYCQIAEPILQNISKKYNLKIYNLNTTDFTEEDIEKFLGSNETFQSGVGTPYLFIIRQEKIIATQQGLTDYEHYVKFLQDNGIV